MLSERGLDQTLILTVPSCSSSPPPATYRHDRQHGREQLRFASTLTFGTVPWAPRPASQRSNLKYPGNIPGKLAASTEVHEQLKPFHSLPPVIRA